MVDVHSKEIRRKNMRAIKTENTFIENCISRLLNEMEIPFTVQIKALPGKPDFVIENYKAIIFTHGCFWHKHDCYLFKPPKTRTEFWLGKIEENCNRDKRNIDDLIQQGWKVLIIWECSLRGKLKLTDEQLSERLEEWLCSENKLGYIDTFGIHSAISESTRNSMSFQ